MGYLNNFSHNEAKAYAKGYRIDFNGEVSYKNRIVKGWINNTGYRCFVYRDNNSEIKHCNYHRLQAYQKFGDAIYEENILVRHLDGNKLNNSINNIEIGSTHDNMMDQPKNVRKEKAIKATKNMIKWDYKKIRKMHEDGLSYREIMVKTGITSKGTLSYIINKRYVNRDDMT